MDEISGDTTQMKQDMRLLAHARLQYVSEEQGGHLLVGGSGFGKIAINALKELEYGLEDLDPNNNLPRARKTGT